MTKAELVKAMAERAEGQQIEAEKYLNAFIGAVSDALGKGGEVSIRDFGTFKVEIRSARKGRNPRTGEEIDIPAKKVVKFTAAKALKAE